MSMFTRLDRELAEPMKAFEAITNGGLDLNDIPATRTALHKLHEIQASELDPVEGVTCEVRSASVPGGASDVEVRLYRPEKSPGPLPALLWIHGGGFVLSSAKQDEMSAKYFAAAVHCVVVSVDYRLAPEFPFPAPLEDCYTALKWLSMRAGDLDVDPSRIVIAGRSAGGGLAAGLALLARDRGEVNVAFQFLIYPMIDDLNVAPAGDKYTDSFIWTRESNRLAWMAYLGSLFGQDKVSPYAAPFRAKDLSGLPPTFLSVGELDLFLNENLDYARRLLDSGVATELHVYPGAYHGFESIAPDADVSRRSIEDRDRAMVRAFRV